MVGANRWAGGVEPRCQGVARRRGLRRAACVQHPEWIADTVDRNRRLVRAMRPALAIVCLVFLAAAFGGRLWSIDGTDERSADRSARHVHVHAHGGHTHTHTHAHSHAACDAHSDVAEPHDGSDRDADRGDGAIRGSHGLPSGHEHHCCGDHGCSGEPVAPAPRNPRVPEPTLAASRIWGIATASDSEAMRWGSRHAACVLVQSVSIRDIRTVVLLT